MQCHEGVSDGRPLRSSAPDKRFAAYLLPFIGYRHYKHSVGEGGEGTWFCPQAKTPVYLSEFTI